MLREPDSELDSEEELQEAFAKGLLKPGLNLVSEKTAKSYTNDVVGMNRQLVLIKQSLEWVERLDLTCDPAPEAPELSHQLEEQNKQSAKQNKQSAKQKTPNSKEGTADPALNDFKRETMFHRQAQSAVLMGIARLKELGIVTKRPDDYFAQMAKTDDHMQKVRENLLKKQRALEHREKVRHIRVMRKTNKQLQAQMRLQREREKRDTMNKVKEFREKKRPNLDFLEDARAKRPKPQGKPTSFGPKRGETKTKYKNQKYGMGGKKRGSKRNTQESTSGFAMPGKNKGKLPFKGKGKEMKRPGKNKRKQQRSKRR